MKVLLFIIILIIGMTINYINYEKQLTNKDLAIQSLVEYYEDEDRRLLLEANELLRLRKEIE